MPVELPELVISSKTQSPETIKKILEDQGYTDFQVDQMTDQTAPPAEPETPPAEVPPVVETPPAATTPPTEPVVGDPPVAGDDDDEEGEGEQGTPPAAPADGSAPPKKKPGSAKLKEKVQTLQAKVDELTQRLETKPPAVTAPPEPEAPPEPDPVLRAEPTWDDFKDSEDQLAAFTKAITQWTYDSNEHQKEIKRREQERTEAPAKKAAADAETELQQVRETFVQRLAPVLQKHPDWQQKVNLIQPTPIMTAVVMRKEDGPQLAYWLAEHPEELTALNAATALKAGYTPAEEYAAIEKLNEAIGRIRYVMSQETETPPSREAPPATPPPATPPATPPAVAETPPPKPKPQPVVPVGNRGSQAVKRLAQMSDKEIRALHPDEYRKLREAEKP